MADFQIKRSRDVWLHNRRFSQGQEDVLQEMGFSDAEKREQVRRGAIVLDAPVSTLPVEESPDPGATLAALQLAAEHDIDLSTVTGTGENGRITKADVESLI